MAETRDIGRSGFPVIEFVGTAFAAGKNAEGWRKAQDTYLARWQGFAELWSKHRLQDLQATIELAVRPWSSLDPRELVAIQQKWMAGIVDRYMLDTVAFAKNAVLSFPIGGIVPPAPARATAFKATVDSIAAPRHRAKRHESEVT